MVEKLLCSIRLWDMDEDVKIAVQREYNNSKGTFETKDKIKASSTGKGNFLAPLSRDSDCFVTHHSATPKLTTSCTVNDTTIKKLCETKIHQTGLSRNTTNQYAAQ